MNELTVIPETAVCLFLNLGRLEYMETEVFVKFLASFESPEETPCSI